MCVCVCHVGSEFMLWRLITEKFSAPGNSYKRVMHSSKCLDEIWKQDSRIHCGLVCQVRV